MSAASRLLAIFYAEFDDALGPRIAFQDPEGFLAPADFALLAPYLVSGGNANSAEDGDAADGEADAGGGGGGGGGGGQNQPPLPPPPPPPPLLPPQASALLVPVPDAAGAPESAARSRVIAVEHPGLSRRGLRVVGFPMALQHATRYARNRLLVTVGLALPAGADTGPAGAVLAKLGAQLRVMEEQSAFLSTPARKASLARTLPAVLAGLRARGECFIRVDGCDTIALRLPPTGLLPEPPDVRAHDVPVRLRDLGPLAAAGGWDVALVALLPLIDGRSHARAIAELAGADLSLVRCALRQLLHFGLIALVDVFQFGNVYAATHRLQGLLHSAPLRRALVRFVATAPGEGAVEEAEAEAVAGKSTVAGRAEPASLPDFEFVFRLLAAFGTGARVGDIAAGAARGRVHARRLCVFGVLHGLLRRVHRYVLVRRGAAVAPSASALLPAPLLRALDGTIHMDELCCAVGAGAREVEEELERIGGFDFVDR
jgi:hypothetical protein